MQKHIFTILCLFFWSIGVFLLNHVALCQKLKFEHIDITKGLSHNDVMQIKQDSKGYIWIGTLDGLNRYDGYSFTNYQREPGNSASLTMNAVTGIWESSKGTLWVHPVNSHLNRFDPGTESFLIDNPLPASDVQFVPRILQDMVEDAEGMIWIFNQPGQLCRMDPLTHRITGKDYSIEIYRNPYNKGNQSGRVNDLFRDKAATLWIGSTEGLHRLNLPGGKTGKNQEVNFTSYWHSRNDTGSFPQVNRIFEDHDGILWLGTQSGLCSFDPGTKQIVKYPSLENNINSMSDDRILDIAEDAQGNLWIATNNGLNKLNSDRNRFTRYYADLTDPFGLRGTVIMTLLIDKSNTLWVGTLQHGISKANLNNYSFPSYQHNPLDPNSLSNNMVTSICEDKEGIIWIGTLGGGLNAWNRSTGVFKHYKHEPGNKASLFRDLVGSILEDREGNLWIGSGANGMIVLSRLNRVSGKFDHRVLQYPSVKNPFAGPVFTLYQDKAGLLWVGTVNGFVVYDPVNNQSRLHPYDVNKPEELSDPWIFSFCEDSAGHMWIGTRTERLNKLDRKTGKYTHYGYSSGNQNGISSNTARCIFKDSKGVIWFGTFGGGLCKLNGDNKSFTCFTMKNGLPSNTIHSIQEDGDGNLWLGTGKGLSKFSIKEQSFENYDINDGLQSNEFTVGHISPGASFKGKDGTLYFGGVNGFNAFHPKNLQRNQYIPPIVINQFKLFDKVLPGKQYAGEIFLNHNENFFSFEFAALDYTNTRKNQYKYKMEGVDKDWVYSGTRRIASYTNVAPGKYIFLVRGSNNDGIWNENGTSISIIVRPPWWRSWWAYSFYGLLLVAAGIAFHRYQKQKVIAVEREKAQKKELAQAKEIEKAYHQLKETQAQLVQQEKMASLGELTAGIAHEIQNPLNFVNNFSDVNKELLEELKAEANKGNIDEVKAIADDVILNEDKINHHGKRADAIVKGMLQHSRISTGQKEPTDINSLVNEYLRLAYHGLRAKDSSFSATSKTELDKNLGKISVVPQEIGRVLLNLINNAFHAVNEKQKENPTGYEPTVIVTTGKSNAKVEIKVTDNGNGIPENIVDKIFQPFFTTKPAGQGTGLGLSISYDIVMAHNGDIRVETNQGEGTEFLILLPAGPL